MRQVPGRALWLGNAGDLRDARAVLAAGIAAIVELADSEPFAVLPRELIRCRLPLSDGGDKPAWLLRLAVESVAALLRASVPVLVCCSAGMSRSVCGGRRCRVGEPDAGVPSAGRAARVAPWGRRRPAGSYRP